MYGFGKMGSTILGSMSDLTVTGGAQTRRRPRKLTILLHPPEYAARHVGGVNALAALRPTTTARARRGPAVHRRSRRHGPRVERGRGRVRADVRRDDGGPLVVVNGAGDGSFLAGCRRAPLRQFRSNHQGVGAGRPRGHGSRPACVARGAPDADYVTRLAAPDRARPTRFASAGLGGDQVYLWDIEAVVRPAATAPRDDAALVRAMEGQTDSAYALAMDAAGTTIVSGCSSGRSRWDARDSPSKPMKLGVTRERAVRGDGSHRAAVRHGVERRDDPAGDVGQRRCVQTLGNVHRRGVGVWSVAMDESWHAAYSGGADGRVHVTDLARRRSAPLFQEPAGVIDLRLAEDGASVWAATMSSRVRRWSTRAPRDAGGAGGSRSDARRRRAEPGAWFSVKAEQNESATEADHLAETAKPRNRRETVAKPDPHPPTHAAPLATIAGAPPIVEHAQLTDRTRVLAKDAEGAVAVGRDAVRTDQSVAPGTDFAATREAESPKCPSRRGSRWTRDRGRSR